MPAYTYTGELDPATFHNLVDIDGRTVVAHPGDTVNLPDEVTVADLAPVPAGRPAKKKTDTTAGSDELPAAQEA